MHPLRDRPSRDMPTSLPPSSSFRSSTQTPASTYWQSPVKQRVLPKLQQCNSTKLEDLRAKAKWLARSIPPPPFSSSFPRPKTRPFLVYPIGELAASAWIAVSAGKWFDTPSRLSLSLSLPVPCWVVFPQRQIGRLGTLAWAGRALLRKLSGALQHVQWCDTSSPTWRFVIAFCRSIRAWDLAAAEYALCACEGYAITVSDYAAASPRSEVLNED